MKETCGRVMTTNRQTAATDRQRNRCVTGKRKDNRYKTVRRHTRTHIKCGDKRHALMECVQSGLCSRGKCSCCRGLVALAHCVTNCMCSVSCPGVLSRTMGGTVSNWIYLEFHRDSVSSQSLIRSSFHSKNGQIISDMY